MDYLSNQPVANNTAIVWRSYYPLMNLYCMSNSSSSSVSASIQYPYSSSWFHTTRCGTGCYRLYSTLSYLSSSYQGIFTCNIQDSRGIYLGLHFGIYPNGFNGNVYLFFGISQVVLISSMVACVFHCYNDTTHGMTHFLSCSCGYITVEYGYQSVHSDLYLHHLTCCHCRVDKGWNHTVL